MLQTNVGVDLTHFILLRLLCKRKPHRDSKAATVLILLLEPVRVVDQNQEQMPSPAAPEGKSSILSTTDLDTPDFRWVGLKKLTWQVGLLSPVIHLVDLALTLLAHCTQRSSCFFLCASYSYEYVLPVHTDRTMFGAHCHYQYLYRAV